jgi:hypothetical protein
MYVPDRFLHGTQYTEAFSVPYVRLMASYFLAAIVFIQRLVSLIFIAYELCLQGYNAMQSVEGQLTF